MEDFKIIKDYLKERIEIDTMPDGFSKGMSEGTIKHKNSDVLMALARLERALEKQSNENGKIMAKKAITITVDEQVIVDAKKRAEYEHRPFSNHIEWLLIKDIREGEKNNKITPTDAD